MSRRVARKLKAAPPPSAIAVARRRRRLLLKYTTWTGRELAEFDQILADMRDFTADAPSTATDPGRQSRG